MSRYMSSEAVKPALPSNRGKSLENASLPCNSGPCARRTAVKKVLF